MTTPLREQQRSPKAPVLPSAAITSPHPTSPVRSLPIQAVPSLLSKESSREGLRPPCCRLQLWPDLARPDLAAPRPNELRRALLGLTPKDAQLGQATSASIRLRVSVTGITSVSKRPCLGLQSPRPTSLPASLAISATSPRFSTSGSY